MKPLTTATTAVLAGQVCLWFAAALRDRKLDKAIGFDGRPHLDSWTKGANYGRLSTIMLILTETLRVATPRERRNIGKLIASKIKLLKNGV